MKNIKFMYLLGFVLAVENLLKGKILLGLFFLLGTYLNIKADMKKESNKKEEK